MAQVVADVSAPHAPQAPSVWPRRAVLAVTAVIALGVGAAVGAGGATNGSQVSKLKAQNAALANERDVAQSDAQSTRDQLTDAQSLLDTAQTAAQDALATARKQVAAQNASTVAKLKAQQASLNQRSKDLSKQEDDFQSQVSSYNDSAISEGVYVIGQDVSPGTYKTSGADGSNTSGCYYAMLNSTDTSDIATNNITQGPATVTISSSYAAFDTSGCNDWHKVG